MHNFDTAIVASMQLQLLLNPRSVSNEKQLVNMGILFQRHDRTADNIRWAEIASHRIQRDLHRSAILRASGPECKIKKIERGGNQCATTIGQRVSNRFEPLAG